MATRSEKSAEAVVAAYTGRRAEGMGGVITELSKARGLRCSCVKLATNPARVKPSMDWQRDNQFCRTRIGETGNEQEGLPAYYLNCANRPVRTRMPGGVGGVQSIMAAPYPDEYPLIPQQDEQQGIECCILFRSVRLPRVGSVGSRNLEAVVQRQFKPRVAYRLVADRNGRRDEWPFRPNTRLSAKPEGMTVLIWMCRLPGVQLNIMLSVGAIS